MAKKDATTEVSRGTIMRRIGITSLLGLLFALVALLQRYSIWVRKEQYSRYTAVLTAEFLKFVMTGIYIVKSGGNLMAIAKRGRPMAFPALTYFFQNVLGYWIYSTGISSNEVAVLMQGKLLTSAVMSVVFLNKHLSPQKWRSLATITLGGILIIRSVNEKVEDVKTASSPFLGAIGTLLSCLTSAGAGILLEIGFKKPTKSSESDVEAQSKAEPQSKLYKVAVRNFQLSVFSLGFSLLSIVTLDFQHSRDYGPFYGISLLMFLCSLMMAVAGLYVGLVISELDVIYKNLATTTEIMLSTIFSIVIFGLQVKMDFVIGAPIIVLAVFSYASSV